MMQRLQRGAAYWFALHDLLNLLSYRTMDHHLKDGTIHHGLDNSPLITNWEHTLQMDFMTIFSQLRIFHLR